MWMAITSLILGIISFLAIFDTSPWDEDTMVGLFFFTSGGITLGILTLHNKFKGKNMAIAGIVLSSIALFVLFGLLVE